MPGEYRFVPCNLMHNPVMQPHGRIIHTKDGYDEHDCSHGGHLIRCMDSADALLEVLCVMGGCISEERARLITREIRAHGIPEYLLPTGRDPLLYLATRHAMSKTPRWRSWAAKMAS